MVEVCDSVSGGSGGGDGDYGGVFGVSSNGGGSSAG